MRAIDLCQTESVTVAERTRRGWKPRIVAGHRYQEFAVHQWGRDMFDDWRISHLPSGCLIGAGFSTVDQAAEAMVEIAKLRNDWAVFQEADATLKLRNQVAKILERHKGELRAGRKEIQFPHLNGYQPDQS
jgi:hypothetical protein